MSLSSRASSISTTPLRQWVYLAGAVCPIAAFIALFMVGIWQELRAKQQVRAIVRQIESRGEPVDNTSLTKLYDSQAEQTRSVKWQRICEAATSLENLYWVALVSEEWDDLGRFVPPSEDWKMTPALESYSRDAQPIIAELILLLDSPEPIWEPIVFKDFNTLLPGLQSARVVARVLAYEARFAYHAGDHERAIQTLALIPKLVDAIKLPNFIVVELVGIALTGVHQGQVRESLANDYWNVKDIIQLKQQFASRADEKNCWRATVATEKTFAMEMFGINGGTRGDVQATYGASAVFHFNLSASHQFALLKHFEQAASTPVDFEFLDPASFTAMQDRNYEELHANRSLLSVPFANVHVLADLVTPAYEAFAEAYTRTHRDRRFTLCALAIKEFQLTHHRWPTSLEELREIGLSRSDLLARPNMPFGYRIASDSSHVLLWTVAPTGSDEPVEAAPPSTMEKHANYLDAMETTIR